MIFSYREASDPPSTKMNQQKQQQDSLANPENFEDSSSPSASDQESPDDENAVELNEMLDEGMADSGPSRRFLRGFNAQVQAVHVRLQEDATAGQEQAAAVLTLCRRVLLHAPELRASIIEIRSAIQAILPRAEGFEDHQSSV